MGQNKCTQNILYRNKVFNKKMTKSNECSLLACFESLQCPQIVLTVIKKGMFFKSFRGAAPDPARGLTAPPRPPAGFHLGRPTLSYRATALSCR